MTINRLDNPDSPYPHWIYCECWKCKTKDAEALMAYLTEGARQMADEDLLKMIETYDRAAIRYEADKQNCESVIRQRDSSDTAKKNAGLELQRRCGPNIPKRYLRASSGNVYEVTADSINKIEIQGGK